MKERLCTHNFALGRIRAGNEPRYDPTGTPMFSSASVGSPRLPPSRCSLSAVAVAVAVEVAAVPVPVAVTVAVAGVLVAAVAVAVAVAVPLARGSKSG